MNLMVSALTVKIPTSFSVENIYTHKNHDGTKIFGSRFFNQLRRKMYNFTLSVWTHTVS